MKKALGNQNNRTIDWFCLETKKKQKTLLQSSKEHRCGSQNVIFSTKWVLKKFHTYHKQFFAYKSWKEEKKKNYNCHKCFFFNSTFLENACQFLFKYDSDDCEEKKKTKKCQDNNSTIYFVFRRIKSPCNFFWKPLFNHGNFVYSLLIYFSNWTAFLIKC